MFRPMVRSRQRLSDEECAAILEKEKRGVLSVLGDGGYPYCMPLNHWYCREDGRLYFHSGKAGHRLDALRACDKVCYCVMDEGYRREGEWALNIRSVIVFGRMELIDDKDKTREICTLLTRKFTDDEAYLEKEIRTSLAHTQLLALTPEHMTGKLVNEA